MHSNEHVELKISNGANYEMWKADGMKNSVTKAKEFITATLKKGNKSPLDAEKSNKLSEILEQYNKLLS